MALPQSFYRERRPPAALAEHILCLWTQEIGAGTAPYAHRVVPDGCIDIVWIGEAAPMVVGPMTATVTVVLPPGTVVAGARFRPGHAPSLLGLPASDVVDVEVPLSDCWRADLAAPRTAEAKLAALSGLLLRRTARPADPLATAAVTWLARRPAGRVGQLAGRLEVSARQLQRRFAEAVGYGPKTFQRIVRFQRVLAMAPRRDLAALAAAAGYADQAHMTRDFVALAGRTPAALLPAGSALAMSDFFKTNAVGDP